MGSVVEYMFNIVGGSGFRRLMTTATSKERKKPTALNLMETLQVVET